MIRYTDSLLGIDAQSLKGFFVGWPNPPSPETHFRLLEGSMRVQLAIDDETDMVVGFLNAVGDGVLSAYLPLLEVLPAYQGRGIGAELVRRMLESLKEFYMIDLTCDQDLQAWYSRLGLKPSTGMFFRNYDRQSGDQSR